MSIYTRFFGKREPDDGPDDLVAAARDGADLLGLQVLFADGLRLDPAAVTQALREYHPALADARCELAPELNQEGKLFGLAGRTVISLCRCGQSANKPSATAPTAAPASSTPSRPATCRRPCRSCNQESGGAAWEPVQHRVAFVPQLLDQPGLRGIVAEQGRLFHVGEKMFGGRGGVLHGG
jgi:hypothetical protein